MRGVGSGLASEGKGVSTGLHEGGDAGLGLRNILQAIPENGLLRLAKASLAVGKEPRLGGIVSIGDPGELGVLGLNPVPDILPEIEVEGLGKDVELVQNWSLAVIHKEGVEDFLPSGKAQKLQEKRRLTLWAGSQLHKSGIPHQRKWRRDGS